MTFRDLLDHLSTLDAAALDRPVCVLVAGQCLAILRVNDGDGPPLLDTGVLAVSLVGAEE